MTARPEPVMPSPRMRQILTRCYRGENRAAVLERALVMPATSDGHLQPNGQIKANPGGRPVTRRPS